MTKQTTVPAETRPEAGLPTVFGRLRNEIDRLFDDFSLAAPPRSIFAFPAATRFSPAMELTDKKDHYELSLELPGMEEKDIDVECAEGMLTISGEKREEAEEKTDGYLVSERSYGSFRRQLTLPADVDPERIDAKFSQGVLKLNLKKDEKARSQSRKIKIG